MIKHKRWKNKEEKKIKPHELAKFILQVTILTLISGGGSPLRPVLPMSIKAIFTAIKNTEWSDTPEKKIIRTLKGLEKTGILYISENEDQLTVTLNNKNNKVIQYSIKSLLDFKKKQKQWNGKWFMVFFDVPEIQRNKRDYLRRYLIKLGFFPYQKSVYIFPYECEEEIKLIKTIVEGAKYMKYIVAEKIEDEVIVKHYFGLTG